MSWPDDEVTVDLVVCVPRRVRDEFWDYRSDDPGLVARSAGWAVFFALMLLEIGLGGRPTYERVGRDTAERATAAFRG